MAQRRVVHSDEELSEEPEAFLQRRGILPGDGGLTERQLELELTRRGWRWRIDAETVKATKAYTISGTETWNPESSKPDRVAALASVLADAIRFDEERGLTLMGPLQADIAIRAPDQRIVAIGEVKGTPSLSDRLAADLRGNLVRYSTTYSLVPFFLLITQDVGYLWDQRAGVLPFSPATLTFPMAPVVARYLPWLDPGERPGATELGLAVAEWLDALANPNPRRSAPAGYAFAGTDFLDAIQGASIATDARV